MPLFGNDNNKAVRRVIGIVNAVAARLQVAEKRTANGDVHKPASIDREEKGRAGQGRAGQGREGNKRHNHGNIKRHQQIVG